MRTERNPENPGFISFNYTDQELKRFNLQDKVESLENLTNTLEDRIKKLEKIIEGNVNGEV